mgnify:CR=1 FL=1
MSREQADWIDKRLRQTTNLGEASALVANDIAANQPMEHPRALVVIELSGGNVWDVYSIAREWLSVVLLEHDDAESIPGTAARYLKVKPLSDLSTECKAIMFDSGISIRSQL